MKPLIGYADLNVPKAPKAPRRLARTTRVKTYNAKRKGHRFPGREWREYRGWIQNQPCELCAFYGCQQASPSDPAHLVSRGAGAFDAGNLVPLCRACHRLIHQIGGVPIAAASVNLWERAVRLFQRFLSQRWRAFQAGGA